MLHVFLESKLEHQAAVSYYPVFSHECILYMEREREREREEGTEL